MLKDDVYFATAETLAPDLRAGRLSPVELTQGFLDRIARWNDRYNAFERPKPQPGLRQGRRAASDLRANNWHGPLHGVPYAAKDLFDTKGVVTAWGTRFLRDRVPAENATVVGRLAPGRGGGAARAGRGGAAGQARDGRVRGLPRLPVRERVGERPRPQPVGSVALDRRLVVGLGRGRGRGSRHV